MPRTLIAPTDRDSAKEVLKNFPEMAYILNYREVFEKACHILYGEEMEVRVDLSHRMMFCCTMCIKEMNSELAMMQHTQSGTHQKNLDKRMRERKDLTDFKLPNYKHQGFKYQESKHYDPKSLRSMLLTSVVKPVGLQMLEEYIHERGRHYYKCNLCGAHGKLDPIYKHIIGNRHTDKYIKSGVVLKSSVITPKERESIREQLIDREGVDVSAIKTYRGHRLYPKKWETCAIPVSKKDLKRPSPGPSQSPTGLSRPVCSLSPDRSPDRSSSSNSSSKRMVPSRESSPTLPYRNRSPPPLPDEKKVKTEGEPADSVILSLSKTNIETQDQSTQKFDLEELMVQFNFIVKTNHLPDFDIHTPEDAKAALDIMFKISSALYFINKNQIENARDSSPEVLQKLQQKKKLLSTIMGYVKLRMEAAFKEQHGPV